VGEDVRTAQYLLSGNNVFRTRFYPRDLIDGIYGVATASAAQRAKYELGYPRSALEPTFDDRLRAFLVGSTELPASFAARREQRLQDASVE
jgi:hypothetical protein